MTKKMTMYKTIIIAMGITPVLFLIAGLIIGYKSHPYESCSREHVGADNIGECIWLKIHGGN